MTNDFIKGATDRGPARAAKGGFPYPGHGPLSDQPRILLREPSGHRAKRVA